MIILKEGTHQATQQSELRDGFLVGGGWASKREWTEALYLTMNKGRYYSHVTQCGYNKAICGKPITGYSISFSPATGISQSRGMCKKCLKTSAKMDLRYLGTELDGVHTQSHMSIDTDASKPFPPKMGSAPVVPFDAKHKPNGFIKAMLMGRPVCQYKIKVKPASHPSQIVDQIKFDYMKMITNKEDSRWFINYYPFKLDGELPSILEALASMTGNEECTVGVLIGKSSYSEFGGYSMAISDGHKVFAVKNIAIKRRTRLELLISDELAIFYSHLIKRQ